MMFQGKGKCIYKFGVVFDSCCSDQPNPTARQFYSTPNAYIKQRCSFGIQSWICLLLQQTDSHCCFGWWFRGEGKCIFRFQGAFAHCFFNWPNPTVYLYCLYIETFYIWNSIAWFALCFDRPNLIAAWMMFRWKENAVINLG